jgi:NADH-quinone oxidoreductase subunit E
MNPYRKQAQAEAALQLSAHLRQEIDHWCGFYPPERKQSALLAALRAAQHENGGYLSTEMMDAVADYLELPRIAVYEVASFYSMFELKPVGRHTVSVCSNISCMLRGADALLDAIRKEYHLELGQTSACGKIYLKKEEECLAACTAAPMMQVDHRYYENLTPEQALQILRDLD